MFRQVEVRSRHIKHLKIIDPMEDVGGVRMRRGGRRPRRLPEVTEVGCGPCNSRTSRHKSCCSSAHQAHRASRPSRPRLPCQCGCGEGRAVRVAEQLTSAGGALKLASEGMGSRVLRLVVGRRADLGSYPIVPMTGLLLSGRKPQLVIRFFNFDFDFSILI